MNKVYLLLLSLIFYPLDNVFQLNEQFHKFLFLLLFIILVHFLKIFIFKIDISKKSYTSIKDSTKDLFPIFSVLVLLSILFFELSFIKENFGTTSLIISICYIIVSFFSSLALEKQRIVFFIILLNLEYFLVALIPFIPLKPSKTALMVIYFTFASFLVSLKLLSLCISNKLSRNITKSLSPKLSCKSNSKFKKSQTKSIKDKSTNDNPINSSSTISIFTIIFLLSSLYPTTLGVLAITFFKSRNLILFPLIVIFYLAILKKLSNVSCIKYRKTFNILLIIFPALILYLTLMLL